MAAQMEYILDGRASGPIGKRLMRNGGDPSCMRPYIGNDGYDYVDVPVANGKWVKDPKTGLSWPQYKPKRVLNANATLRKENWIEFDEAVERTMALEMGAVADLRQKGLIYNLRNGFGKTVLQYQTSDRAGSATLSMDGLRRSQRDRRRFDLRGLPLPLIRSDFSASAREQAVSESGPHPSPLDTMGAEDAAEVASQLAEKLLIGTGPTYQYATYPIPGYLTLAQRNTKVITAPTGGWTPDDLLNELAEAIQLLIDDRCYGPYTLYYNSQWSIHLQKDYSAVKGDLSVLDRIKKLDRLTDVKMLNYLPSTGYRMVLVQMRPATVQEVIGMDWTTIQWEEAGGMELNWAVLGIFVPRLRYDYDGRCGIVDMATA